MATTTATDPNRLRLEGTDFFSSSSGAVTFRTLVSMDSAVPVSAGTKTTTPKNVTLRRSLDSAVNQALFAWHTAALTGSQGWKSDVVLTLDGGGTAALRYRLRGAWCDGLTVDASSQSEPAGVEVRLRCDAIEVVA